MTALFDEIQEVRTRYPEGTRSAVLPALRLAQERYGWLSTEKQYAGVRSSASATSR